MRTATAGWCLADSTSPYLLMGRPFLKRTFFVTPLSGTRSASCSWTTYCDDPIIGKLPLALNADKKLGFLGADILIFRLPRPPANRSVKGIRNPDWPQSNRQPVAHLDKCCKFYTKVQIANSTRTHKRGNTARAPSLARSVHLSGPSLTRSGCDPGPGDSELRPPESRLSKIPSDYAAAG